MMYDASFEGIHLRECHCHLNVHGTAYDPFTCGQHSFGRFLCASILIHLRTVFLWQVPMYINLNSFIFFYMSSGLFLCHFTHWSAMPSINLCTLSFLAFIAVEFCMGWVIVGVLFQYENPGIILKFIKVMTSRHLVKVHCSKWNIILSVSNYVIARMYNTIT